MSLQHLIYLIYFLFAALAALYIFVFYVKLSHICRGRRYKACLEDIQPVLNAVINDCSEDSVARFKDETAKKRKQKLYRVVLEDLLLEYMDDIGFADSARRVAYALDIPKRCLAPIRSKDIIRVTFGCRKAGLFKYKDAVPDMMKALDFISGDVQFQVLMAFARIGDMDALCQGFDKISGLVLINARTASEIIGAFSGDRYSLFKRMLSSETNYIAALFLETVDSETARELSPEITRILHSDDKELRISATKAFGRMGMAVFLKRLIPCLRDEAWEVRASAAKMLGTLYVPGAETELAEAIHDREWWVRQNAAVSLLSYPESEQYFKEALKANDAYAHDSIVYVLENAGEYEMLERLLGETEYSRIFRESLRPDECAAISR